MHMQKRTIFFCALALFLPTAVSAATLSLQADPQYVGAGDIVHVGILVDSLIPVNAFSGTLTYSKTLLEPVAVSDGDSVVNLWITHPAVPTVGAAIPFAGVTPGGFSGSSGTLFSVLFRARSAGIAKISLADLQVLRNDGVGGKELVLSKPLSISIARKSLGGYTEPADTTPPEVFSAYLGTDPQVFDGRSYLVFAAVDKASGVDRYAVAESRVPAFLLMLFPLSWTTVAASPIVLQDQNLTSTVYIRAIDRAGNERLSVFPPIHLFTAYEKAVLMGILIVVVLLSQRRWGRRFRKNL